MHLRARRREHGHDLFIHRRIPTHPMPVRHAITHNVPDAIQHSQGGGRAIGVGYGHPERSPTLPG